MTPEQYLQILDTDSAAFAAATTEKLDEPIAHLGDWSVRDLVEHLGRVYSAVIANAPNTTGERAEAGQAGEPPDGEAITGWFAERRQTLLDTLTSLDPKAASLTFAGPKTVGWWIRRMAHETAVHRWDAEAAVGTPVDIDGDLAADGIDEYTEVGLRFSSSKPDRTYPDATLHLHRTDGAGEWMFATDPDGKVVVTQEHGKGDAAVRGPGGALLLWIWGRPVDGLEIFGDPDVAAAWQAVAP